MIPDNLLYTKTHEWLRQEGGTAVVGITQFAQEQLGDLTYVELPAKGATLTAGAEMGVVESVKAASELYAPVDGEVIDVNEALASDPGLVNSSPYDQGWLIKVAVTRVPEDLLTPAQYQELVAGEQH